MTITQTTTPTRIAFVVQRFGPEIIGGAETHAAQLINHLRSDLGWDIEVFTTTARDYNTWANSYPSGTDIHNGIPVHRFPISSGRSKLFSIYNHATAPLLRLLRAIRPFAPVARALESLWIYLQGPVCPDLVEALKMRKAEFQAIIAITYLYYPTLATLRHLGPQCIVIPTAHDEHPFHFRIVQDLLASAKALVPNTGSEAALIHKVLGSECPPMEVAGIGINRIERPATGSPCQQPYLLYLGRVSRGKNVHKLIAWFQEAQSSGAIRSDTNLVLAGIREDDVTVPNDPRISYIGALDEAQRNAYLAHAAAVINPSSMESMSMITLEAMAAGVPAIVNGESDVLRAYAEETKTIFTYNSKEQFTNLLASVLSADWQSTEKANDLRTTQEWVLEHYSWKRVLAVFAKFVRIP